ncbi:hypothetical protein [Lentibacillus saliphilus]|uniref:hypothetical protein n=1 Tax=Lentibacillus saliphilus TaxID=2737028 RepID=UPI001C2F2FB0|nr:hypothetical protein [Lentibacillus saliphilus]
MDSSTIIMGLLPIIIMITLIAVIVSVIVFAVKAVRRIEGRAEERLRMEKAHAARQKQQSEAMSDVQERLKGIEAILKQVD